MSGLQPSSSARFSLCGLPDTNTAFSPAITLSQCLSPVAPARQVLPSPSSARLWSPNSHVSLSVCPQTFSTLGMLSLPVTEAQRVLSLSTSIQIRFPPSFLRVHFCFHSRFVSKLSAFSSEGLRCCCCCCCCCKVHRNTELQADQKLLQPKKNVFKVKRGKRNRSLTDFCLTVSHEMEQK